MMEESIGQIPLGKEVWAFNDAYSIRWRALNTKLYGKVYEVSEEDLHRFKAEVVASSYEDDLDELRQEVLESPAGLLAYYQATRRREEVEAILAAEGLTPTIQE